MEPFRESDLLYHLITYLREQGFHVKQQVPVQGGRADIVARKGDSVLLVEAKGEDRGGYASAEMNLQMGFGQVLSRMNEPSWGYGLALPNTPDFRRALSKYARGTGIERLGWTFFMVSSTGKVDIYDAVDFQRFIDTLE
jgi:hypothetical protein